MSQEVIDPIVVEDEQYSINLTLTIAQVVTTYCTVNHPPDQQHVVYAMLSACAELFGVLVEDLSRKEIDEIAKSIRDTLDVLLDDQIYRIESKKQGASDGN